MIILFNLFIPIQTNLEREKSQIVLKYFTSAVTSFYLNDPPQKNNGL